MGLQKEHVDEAEWIIATMQEKGLNLDTVSLEKSSCLIWASKNRRCSDVSTNLNGQQFDDEPKV